MGKKVYNLYYLESRIFRQVGPLDLIHLPGPNSLAELTRPTLAFITPSAH
jgi:hypothetical protein